MKIIRILAATATLSLVGSSPMDAQGKTVDDSLLVASLHSGASYIRQVITTSAERMSAEDYAFRPTPAVRSFAELIGHIADTNYHFCSTMKGEKPPVSGIEKTRTARAELQRSLAESFTYCESALAAMNGPRARELVKFQGRSYPAVAVMNFRTYHALLHYGNVITYMRLRGKVPPSTEP